jgi:hypothetical protein
VAVAHNAKAFDLLFVLNRLVRMKLLPEHLIMKGQKIMCLKFENVTWLDSLNYLAMPIRKLPEAFGLTSHKSWYPHLFNTRENINYVVPAPDVSYYDVEQMRIREKTVPIVVRDRREKGSVQQQARARKLLPCRRDGAARGVPHISQTLSTDRECGSVPRVYDYSVGV